MLNEMTYAELNALRLAHGNRCCDPPKPRPKRRRDHKPQVSLKYILKLHRPIHAPGVKL